MGRSLPPALPCRLSLPRARLLPASCTHDPHARPPAPPARTWRTTALPRGTRGPWAPPPRCTPWPSSFEGCTMMTPRWRCVTQWRLPTLLPEIHACISQSLLLRERMHAGLCMRAALGHGQAHGLAGRGRQGTGAERQAGRAHRGTGAPPQNQMGRAGGQCGQVATEAPRKKRRAQPRRPAAPARGSVQLGSPGD